MIRLTKEHAEKCHNAIISSLENYDTYDFLHDLVFEFSIDGMSFQMYDDTLSDYVVVEDDNEIRVVDLMYNKYYDQIEKYCIQYLNDKQAEINKDLLLNELGYDN